MCVRSWSVNNLGVRIAKRDFDPGFFVDHFVKDMVRADGTASAGFPVLCPVFVRWATPFTQPHTPHPQGIALEEARRMQLSLPGLALAHQFYIGLQAQGGGKLGTQALALVLERMNGMGVDRIDGGKK